MRIVEVLADQFLRKRTKDEPLCNVKVHLMDLLDDIYLMGKANTHTDEHPVERLCHDFSALGIAEMRCARCHHPAWEHEQPVQTHLAMMERNSN